MKKMISTCFIYFLFVAAALAQLQKPAQGTLKKQDSAKVTLRPQPIAGIKKTIPPAPVSIYTLTAAKISIKTSTDNKEYPSTALLYIMENNTIFGKGKNLFGNTIKNHELGVNTETEFSLLKFNNIAEDVFSLTNLQNKGLSFVIYYLPGFSLDAWKIESVTLTLEFKDQYGNLHPHFGNRKVIYHISNGTLTMDNFNMTGSTDGFFTPLPVTITNGYY
jgi:hypothetical protein